MEAMAVWIRLCLLAVVFATAWVAGASSVPDQVDNSQKSVDCMPCSRTYIADAYLSTLTGQLAQHRGLTEVPDFADLCKGLVDDLDVPAHSEVHRQLVGEGSHRRLVYSLKFGNCEDDVVKFLDGYDANLVIIENLPSGVFADPFELQHFIERKVFLDVAVFGDTNLELPSALSNRSAVEIHFDLNPSTSMDCNLAVELPLHARYPREVICEQGDLLQMDQVCSLCCNEQSYSFCLKRGGYLRPRHVDHDAAISFSGVELDEEANACNLHSCVSWDFPILP